VAGVVWRIARKPYALDRQGAGARQDGGRWNRLGVGVIYASGTVATAALEKYVHMEGVVPADLVLVRIELPENCSEEIAAAAALPVGWDLVPPGPASMDFGTTWAQANRSLVLRVPSALLPEESNAVLNPNHPEFAAVTMTILRPFRYDDRMYTERVAPAKSGKTKK
jgi:RES domain-containing protein